MGAFRYDIGGLKAPQTMPNGWLRVDGHLTRAGVFEYRNSDGSTRRELRPDDEVFKADSLASFSMVPVTDDHPDAVLDSTNTSKYQKGTVGETINRDGDAVQASMLITDGALVDKMRAGKCGLSCGYEVDLEKTSGNHPVYGRYDAVQRNIRGNHVAIVSAGRAGAIARARMDAAQQCDDVIMKYDTIKKEGGKYCVYSADGSKRLGEYDTEEEAKKRLTQVEEHKNDAEQPRDKDGKFAGNGGGGGGGLSAPVDAGHGVSHVHAAHGTYEVRTLERGGDLAGGGGGEARGVAVSYKPKFVAPGNVPKYEPSGTHDEKMAQYKEYTAKYSKYMEAHAAASHVTSEPLGTHPSHEAAAKAIASHHATKIKKDSTDQAPAVQALARTIGVDMDEQMKAALADAAAQKMRADVIEAELATQRSRADKAEGACDALRAQLTEAETKIRTDGPTVSDLENQVKVLTSVVSALKADVQTASDPARRRADVRARVKLETAGAAILGSKFNADALEDAEIMGIVLEKLNGPIPKDRSDEYLRARFDAAVEGYFANEAALSRARDSIRVDDQVRADSRTARQRMIDRNRNHEEK